MRKVSSNRNLIAVALYEQEFATWNNNPISYLNDVVYVSPTLVRRSLAVRTSEASKSKKIHSKFAQFGTIGRECDCITV